MKYALLLSGFFFLLCCKQPAAKNEMGHQIAQANGIENFKDVKMLEFTFNVQRDTLPPSSRHWQWYPQTNEAVFITDSGSTKFNRTDTSTPELRKLNARFTNDEYWLLYPLHLSWDKGFEMRDSNMMIAPISGKKMRKITTQYNNTDGFTPGDMYDVFLDENNRVQEWAFHSGGKPEASLVTTWENYKDYNGLSIAQEHKSKDGKFKIWFTGIQVKK